MCVCVRAFVFVFANRILLPFKLNRIYSYISSGLLFFYLRQVYQFVYVGFVGGLFLGVVFSNGVSTEQIMSEEID